MERIYFITIVILTGSHSCSCLIKLFHYINLKHALCVLKLKLCGLHWHLYLFEYIPYCLVMRPLKVFESFVQEMGHF